jgi:broad specificity phosphatase PhoE
MKQLRALTGTVDFSFMRHGESEGNRDGIMQGRTPFRLTETGRAQAREAGGWFRGRGIDLVLTSPLPRAAETAAIVAEVAGMPPAEPVQELTEIGTGIFTGLRFTEAQARYPAQWQVFQQQSWEGVPDAERIEELLARAGRLWDLLAARAEAGRVRILCVTHSGFLQWIIRSTFGGRTWMPLFSGTGNCGVSHLRVTNAAQDGAPSGHMATWTMINADVRGEMRTDVRGEMRTDVRGVDAAAGAH